VKIVFGCDVAFNSLSFLLIFLPVAWLLTVSLRRDVRPVLAIALGICFLAWAGPLPLYWTLAILVWVSLFSSVIVYVKSFFLRRFLLGLAVSGLIMALVLAKYFLTGLMTVGLSFLIFFAVSAVVDISRHPDHLCLSHTWTYLTFFPKFLTGPLIPYHRFAAQLKPAVYDWQMAHQGFRRLTAGLFKKLWIADPLGKVADQVFALGTVSGVAEHWLGLFAFSLQIFIDFSAYTDMAIGVARIFGIELGENFNYPYVARSLRDFWRRWHISLGHWFRDYLFLPLGYALERRLYRLKLPWHLRSDRLAAGFVMWLTMLFCGAWHGQGLNFWLWGLFYGTLMQFESARRKKRGPLALLRTQAAVLLGWILFRTDTPAHFVDFLLGLWPGTSGQSLDVSFALLADGRFIWAFSAAMLLAFPLPHRVMDRFLNKIAVDSPWVGVGEWMLWLVSWLLILMALSGASHRPFIYLKF